MGITTDPNDPRLTYGVDSEETDQAGAYLVLTEEERAKGFVRPYRDTYVHQACGTVTKMHRDIAETYARQPNFYGATYCIECKRHLPLNEFVWDKDGETVGS